MYFINYICLGELKYSQHLCMLSTCAKNAIVLYGECSFNLHVQCVFFNKKGKNSLKSAQSAFILHLKYWQSRSSQ